MYNLDSLKRKIAKEGIQATIDYLLSDDLTSDAKKALTKNHVFNSEGYLCLSLLYSLV